MSRLGIWITRLAVAGTVAAGGALASAALGPLYGGELRVAVVDLPATLEPAPARSGGERLALALVHETLVAVAPDGALEPRLLASWSASAGGRELSLRLDPGARFQDDAPVRSDDVARSLRRFLRSGSPAGATLAAHVEGGAAFRAGDTEELPGLVVVDASTLALRMDGPPSSLLPALAAPAAAVVSASGVGAGPFVPALHGARQRLVATAAATHVRGRPYLDRLQVVALADPADAARALRRGDVDVAQSGAGSGPADAGALSSGALLLKLDASRPPFDRPEARALVAAAIDRVALARLVTGAAPAESLLAPFDEPAPQPQARPALGGSITLAVAPEVLPLLSQRVVAHLTALGLSVQARPLPGSADERALAQATLWLWFPEVADPVLSLLELSSLVPPGPELAAALSAAEVETDLDVGRPLLHRAEELLRTTHALVPLVRIPAVAASRRGVQGLRVDEAGCLHLEEAWLEP